MGTVKSRIWSGVFVVVLMLIGANAWALDFTYTVKARKITITGYIGPGGDIVIPETIDGLPVVYIGSNAFNGSTNLTSVIIPDSVLSIGYMAFYNCSALASVTLGNSVEIFESGGVPFYYCSALTNIIVDENNITYSSLDGVLYNKDKTVLIRHPERKAGSFLVLDSVISIEPSAFERSTLLTSVTIPGSVTSIGEHSFFRCSTLTNIIIDESNMTYSSLDGVLYNKDKTALIQYPEGKAGSFLVPDSVINIEFSAFAFCRGLASVTLGNSVDNIGNSAFSSCSGLTSVTLPDSVTVIDSYAFAWCYNLTSVTLGSSVANIGSLAFRSCTSLSTALFLGDAPSMGTDVFLNTAPGFNICYTPEAIGFTTPTWEGYPVADCACLYASDCGEGEICVDGICTPGCTGDQDCDDGNFCNGAETCVDGACIAGSSPCAEGYSCDEQNDACVDCLVDGDCADGAYCNGDETCSGGVCQPGTAVTCPAGELCDETTDACVDCLVDADCADGAYCNGDETCSGGVCQAGTAVTCPAGELCDEANDRCVECLNDGDCAEGEVCDDGVCEIIDNPPALGAGPYLAAGAWPVLPTETESPVYLDQNYSVLWTFSDDFASCSEDCTHSAEYQEVGGSWTALDVTANAAKGFAYVTLPIDALTNATTYAFRYSVTDCASQTTQSAVYYFRVAITDAPPVIKSGPYLAAGSWPVLPTSAARALVLDQNEYVLWTFSDDFAFCSGLCTHRARYKKVDDTTWTWITVSADPTGKKYAYVELPVSSLPAGTYQFFFDVLDCNGQRTYSTTFYYFKIE